MDFKIISSNTYECGENLMNDVNDILEAERYCAACNAYRLYLQHNREKAELYYQNFREQNDKIFKQAIKILDIAIDIANQELAESAVDLIRTMKNTYPEFYNAFYRQLFWE